MKQARNKRKVEAPALPAPRSVETPSNATPSAWVRFWFTPADPIALHAVRALAGLVFLAWLLPLAGDVDAFFGLDGWFDSRAYAEAARLPDSPARHLGWSILFLVGKNPSALHAFYWSAIAVFALFSLGLLPRLTGVLTWIAVVSFATNPVTSFEGEVLLGILAFYLMVGYLLLGLRDPGTPWGRRLLGPLFVGWRLAPNDHLPRPSLAANLSLRLLQVHLALLVVTNGLHKLQFGDWWAGVAFWYPLYPALDVTMELARTHANEAQFYMGMLSLGAYALLAWQIGFPLYAWKPLGRRFLLVPGALLIWVGTALVYQIPIYGPALFVGCLAFVCPVSWRRLLAFTARRRDEHPATTSSKQGSADAPVDLAAHVSPDSSSSASESLVASAGQR